MFASDGNTSFDFRNLNIQLQYFIHVCFLFLLNKFSLYSVYFEMPVESALCHISCVALTALERSFAAVHLFMNFQRGRLCKS